jgi:hypothetical protein
MTAAHSPTNALLQFLSRPSAFCPLPSALCPLSLALSSLCFRCASRRGTASGSTSIVVVHRPPERQAPARLLCERACPRCSQPAARTSRHAVCKDRVEHARASLPQVRRPSWPPTSAATPHFQVGGMTADSIAPWSLRSAAFPLGGKAGWRRVSRASGLGSAQPGGRPPAGPGGSAGRRRPARHRRLVSAAGCWSGVLPAQAAFLWGASVHAGHLMRSYPQPCGFPWFFREFLAFSLAFHTALS